MNPPPYLLLFYAWYGFMQGDVRFRFVFLAFLAFLREIYAVQFSDYAECLFVCLSFLPFWRLFCYFFCVPVGVPRHHVHCNDFLLFAVSFPPYFAQLLSHCCCFCCRHFMCSILAATTSGVVTPFLFVLRLSFCDCSQKYHYHVLRAVGLVPFACFGFFFAWLAELYMCFLFPPPLCACPNTITRDHQWIILSRRASPCSNTPIRAYWLQCNSLR